MIINKKLWLLAAAVFLTFSTWAGWWFYKINRAVFTPLSTREKSVLFEIPKGTTVSGSCLLLEKKGLIRNGKMLVWYILHKKVKTPVKAGEYILSPHKSAWEIFNEITKGESHVFHKLTTPEGLNIKQVSELVEKKFSITKENFSKLCYNTEFVRSLGVEQGESLEGYLFPDTYFFTKDVDAKKIIKKMVERFFSLIKPEYRKKAKKLGYSLHEIVTLSSLIEKETADESERSLISAVYHGRLKRKMRLQCDPTVIYGIKNFNGNITKKDLKTPSLYNTYLNKGLPPGPIANPGIESIVAALYPADKKILYFVSKNNGTHHFSYSLREHNRAVRKYQRIKHKRKRKK